MLVVQSEGRALTQSTHCKCPWQSSQNTARSLQSLLTLQNKQVSLYLLFTASGLLSSPAQINWLNLRQSYKPQNCSSISCAYSHGPAPLITLGSWLLPGLWEIWIYSEKSSFTGWNHMAPYKATLNCQPAHASGFFPHNDLNFLYSGKSWDGTSSPQHYSHPPYSLASSGESTICNLMITYHL